ncbi:hypothetical protein TVAG_475720 [Trichomonas vaginalis G3]|uniref:Uncharacterized protein n=1 Tax=Trichomonas vaginalis (strain ATCC PRA-98 / G3) TaxID=412133 RepID=A2D9Z6_TRIV3|nr:armadillo (ARM) repeat-containing protein family [Trichomonas vaginalis G3]EAY22644.1 hypothetical protein TVAG_475720 [Trichomonas vaginalis G3]KAI5525458.1 armadillo (ARM) repeat-containing protein family [Trichomonas vaginalis G3]|eukprot:XP_001583630.1 hypothetical protein [Trichomonas vaginalis G3]
MSVISNQHSFDDDYILTLINAAYSILFNDELNWEENSSVLCFLSMFTQYITEDDSINIITRCMKISLDEYFETEQITESFGLISDFLQVIDKEKVIEILPYIFNNFVEQNIMYLIPFFSLTNQILELNQKIPNDFIVELLDAAFGSENKDVILAALFFIRDSEIIEVISKIGNNLISFLMDLIDKTDDLTFQCVLFDALERILKITNVQTDEIFKILLDYSEKVTEDLRESYLDVLAASIGNITKLDDSETEFLINIIQESPENSFCLIKSLLARNETKEVAVEIVKSTLISLIDSQLIEAAVSLFAQCFELNPDVFIDFAVEMKEIISRFCFDENSSTQIRSLFYVALSQICMKTNDVELSLQIYENIMNLLETPRERIIEEIRISLSNILNLLDEEKINELVTKINEILIDCNGKILQVLLLLGKQIIEQKSNDFILDSIEKLIIKFCQENPNDLFDESVFESFTDIICFIWNARIAEVCIPFLLGLLNNSKDNNVLYLSIGCLADIPFELFRGNNIAEDILGSVFKVLEATDDVYIRHNSIYLCNKFLAKNVISAKDLESLYPIVVEWFNSDNEENSSFMSVLAVFIVYYTAKSGNVDENIIKVAIDHLPKKFDPDVNSFLETLKNMNVII